MLNFRNTTIVFVVGMIALLVYDLAFALSAWYYVLVTMVYVSLLVYGSIFIGANFYIDSVCYGHTTEKLIALSFDDGPCEPHTVAILDILKHHDIQAAFFCIGKEIDGKEYLVRRLNDDGHIIGSHSFSHHQMFDLFSSSRMYADITRATELIRSTAGVTPRLFRPPYGVTNPNLRKAILRGSYISVGWNVRSFDTIIKDEKKLFDRIISHVTPGSIILLHDTMSVTAKLLPLLIEKLHADGYRFVRLDKLCNIEAYA